LLSDGIKGEAGAFDNLSRMRGLLPAFFAKSMETGHANCYQIPHACMLMEAIVNRPAFAPSGCFVGDTN
jgi:hypothetical protein